METFYKKVGRKYIPVAEYDDEVMDSLPYGDHLISVYPGGSSRRKVTPAFAPVVAAIRYGHATISRAIMDASALRLSSAPLTEGQRAAWEALSKEFGEERHTLQWPAANDAAMAAGKAIQEEADKMMQVPAVKAAYEQFMFVYELTKDQNGQPT